MHLPVELRNAPRRSISSTSCTDPYPLTIGCKEVVLGTIPIEIDGVPFRIASTEDGRVIAIADSMSHVVATSPVNLATLGMVDLQATRLNKALEVVVARLKTTGPNIVETIVITNLGEIQGYFVVTDGDALTALRAAKSDT